MTARTRHRDLVLLSGGMDSATTLYWARAQGSEIVALSFRYGQRHLREIRAARRLADLAGVADHLVLTLPLGRQLTSALTSRRRPLRHGGVRNGIPPSYVPARNIVFLAIALGIAESRGCDRIVLGINALDYSGYPDCRPEFLRAFQRVARVGTKAGVERHAEPRLVAPLLRRSKADIVRLGGRLKVPWALTWSCYEGGRRPCGRCDSCRLRAKGFREAGIPDPAISGRAAPGRRP